MDDDALSLDVVKQRFVDAERALSEMVERLRTLHTAEAEATQAASTLAEAGGALGRYVHAAELATSEFIKLQEAAREAVTSASTLLQGEEVRRLRQEVEELRASTVEQLSSIVSRLDEADRARMRADELSQRLEGVRQQLSARQRKRLGL